jgi:hypothetical protein
MKFLPEDDGTIPEGGETMDEEELVSGEVKTGVSEQGSADPEKPDPEKPEPEKPDPEKPDPEKPDPEKPEPEKPEPEKPEPPDNPRLKKLQEEHGYRPFNLEAVRKGDLLCGLTSDEPDAGLESLSYVGEVKPLTDKFNLGPVHAAFSTTSSSLVTGFENEYLMEPLFLLKGKAVYKGDTIYRQDGLEVVVESIAGDNVNCNNELILSLMQWDKPEEEYFDVFAGEL